MPKLDITNEQAKAILALRGRVANALALFRPMEHQEEYFLAMERDDIIEMLLGGGNRAGKSLCATVAMASLILNQPVIFRDGSLHHMRPERWRREEMKIWVVGYDWKHIGKTMYRLLFAPGMFRIVRDQTTAKWRAWDPIRPGECKREFSTKSPPLIQMTEVVGGDDGISWENKKENQLSAFNTHDGTRIEFFPSTGARPQGDPANVIWIDEKIDDGKWYAELLMRLQDDRGRIMWTAWPDTAPSAEMMAIEERALEQSGKPDQWTFSVKLDGDINVFNKGLHRDRLMSTLDEDELAARGKGVMNRDRWRVYATFSKYTHRLMSTDPSGDDALAKAVREAGGIPGTWTRYLILDPGTANPAVLFVAIPPPHLGDFIVPYDELYMHYTSAKPLAEAIAAKTMGTFFEDFIIDAHAARQTPMGFDGRVGENYEKEFAAAKLTCRRRGSRFSYGSDNVRGRILKLQGTMNIRSDGSTQLRVHGCNELVKQLERYKWGDDGNGNPLDEPAKRQKIDIAQCLEYFASRSDCGYVVPAQLMPEDKSSFNAAVKHLRSCFGRDPVKPNGERSVLCGAAEESQF